MEFIFTEQEQTNASRFSRFLLQKIEAVGGKIQTGIDMMRQAVQSGRMKAEQILTLLANPPKDEEIEAVVKEVQQIQKVEPPLEKLIEDPWEISQDNEQRKNGLEKVYKIAVQEFFPDRQKLPVFDSYEGLLEKKAGLKELIQSSQDLIRTEDQSFRLPDGTAIPHAHMDHLAFYLAHALPQDKIRIGTYKGQAVFIVDRQINPSLQVQLITNCNRPETEEYIAWKEKQTRSSPTDRELFFSGRKTEDTAPIYHLIRQGGNGKAFDYTDLLPSDWKWKRGSVLPIDSVIDGFSQDSDEKEVIVPDVRTPEDFIKLEHELGHSVNDHHDPQTFRETKKMWEMSGAGVPSLNSLTPEQQASFAPLLSKSERGASAIAMMYEQLLNHSGLSLGITPERAKNVLNQALETYRKRFGGKQHFKF